MPSPHSLSASPPLAEDHDDLMAIARHLGPRLDAIASEIVGLFRNELLEEPITYIVPAVWGAKMDGELTESQTRMHERILPVVEECIAAFGFREIDQAQLFALGFLVRGLVIAKVTYMLEVLRGHKSTVEKDILSRSEPLGKA